MPTLQARVSDELASELQRRAKANGHTVSDVIRAAVRSALHNEVAPSRQAGRNENDRAGDRNELYSAR